MAISTVIPRTRPDHPSLDFERLRAEGIQHLEQLATEVWTDFNAHDPGITLLELLSYAITDLGYRTRRLPIGDLVAGGQENAFFSATDILNCSPVTALDYRKLLIDLPGVKNAWIHKYDKPILFTEQDTDYGIRWSGKFVFPHFFEKINEEIEEEIKSFLKEYYYKKDDYPDSVIKDLRDFVKAGVSKGTCAAFGIDPIVDCLGAEACVLSSGLGQEEAAEMDKESPEVCELLNALLCRYGVPELEITAIGEDGETDASYNKIGRSTGTAIEAELLKLNGLAHITIELEDHIDPENKSQTRPVVQRAMKRLRAFRFLGHDYMPIPAIVQRKTAAVCLHIEAEAGEDATELAAEALWHLEQHIAPALRFYTFQEMMDKGHGVEDIYNGPLLDHGFLDDKEVRQAQLRHEIRHSDLISAVSRAEAVQQVRELKWKWADEEEEFGISTTYTVYAEAGPPKKPIIDYCESCVYVTQNGRRCEIRESDLIKALKLKRLMAAGHNVPGGWKPPKGKARPGLSQYRSLQYDLPEVYGVGRYQGKKDSPFYKAGARKQLQAYLAFFDQILAAYLLQLGEVRRLFAVEQDPDSPTYPAADLSGVPGLQELIDEDEEKGRVFEKEDAFTRKDRRNRLLDHMLARFGETFSGYVAALASTCKGTDGDSYPMDFASALRAKSRMLKNLPHIGHDRGRAYDYTGGDKHDVWNTSNVSGLKKRVHLKAGLRGSWGQASLLTKPPYILDLRQLRGKRGAIRYQVAFRALPDHLPPGVDFPYEKALLFGPRHRTMQAAKNKRSQLYAHIWDPEAYELAEDNGRYTVCFKLKGKEELSSEEMSEAEAKRLLECIKDLLSQEPQNEKEGFHLLEHILLRPNDQEDELLSLSLGCNPQYLSPDPYSNWLTVVLPNWPRKMKDDGFKQHLQQLIRQELPAEMMARFCWLDKEQMRSFEERYRVWLEEMAACDPDDCKVTPAANALIQWLNNQPCGCNCRVCCTGETACNHCQKC
ncbi:MAG: hypothetical protein GVY26_21220 [Bacteroidetes bacterium]|jgi:hypothetical protein|nr:hypothetical protein [Bacteroidota bacterium]